MAKRGRIAFGKVGRPHGLRGELRFFPYNEASPALPNLQRGTLILGERTLDVQRLTIQARGATFSLRVPEIKDRNTAAEWTHAELWVEVSAFEDIDDENTYYHWQLAGLKALDHAGEEIGVVRVVQNFGAGDMLVIRTTRGHVDVPFMEPWVGEIDLAQGTIVVDVHWLDPS